MVLGCCGQDFASWQSLKDHISSHPLHEECPKCRKGFSTPTPFRQHMQDSRNHILDQSASINQPVASVNRDRVIQDRNLAATPIVPSDESLPFRPYNGIPTAIIKPLFKAACALRFSAPTVEDIVRYTETTLDRQILGAILEGALRLLPADNSPQGQIDRKIKMAAKAAQATESETSFVAQIQRFRPQSLNEEQQKEEIRRAIEDGSTAIINSTPDVLFLENTIICGSDIKWLEFKNMFGFKSNPFVHRKTKAQLRRYIDTFGNGMVVYKLGYESNHLVMEGLRVMREVEVTQWLGRQEPFQHYHIEQGTGASWRPGRRI